MESPGSYRCTLACSLTYARDLQDAALRVSEQYKKAFSDSKSSFSENKYCFLNTLTSYLYSLIMKSQILLLIGSVAAAQASPILPPQMGAAVEKRVFASSVSNGNGETVTSIAGTGETVINGQKVSGGNMPNFPGFSGGARYV